MSKRRPPPTPPPQNPLLDQITRMKLDSLAQIARDVPPQHHALALAMLGQELLIMAGVRAGPAYARGWLDVIAAHLRCDFEGTGNAVIRLNDLPHQQMH